MLKRHPKIHPSELVILWYRFKSRQHPFKNECPCKVDSPCKALFHPFKCALPYVMKCYWSVLPDYPDGKHADQGFLVVCYSNHGSEACDAWRSAESLNLQFYRFPEACQTHTSAWSPSALRVSPLSTAHGKNNHKTNVLLSTLGSRWSIQHSGQVFTSQFNF